MAARHRLGQGAARARASPGRPPLRRRAWLPRSRSRARSGARGRAGRRAAWPGRIVRRSPAAQRGRGSELAITERLNGLTTSRSCAPEAFRQRGASQSRTLSATLKSRRLPSAGARPPCCLPQDRSRREALPPDRPWRDQEGISQVPDPGRAHRPPGQARRLHPLPQIEIPRFRFNWQGKPAGSARERATPAIRWRALPAPPPASTSSRWRSASTSWPPSWARSWSCRGSSPAGGAPFPSRRSSTRTSAAWGRRACATSSARSARR